MNDNKECENKYSLWLIDIPQSLDKDDVLSHVKVYIPPTVSISQDFSKMINYEWLIKTKFEVSDWAMFTSYVSLDHNQLIINLLWKGWEIQDV